MGNVKIPKWLNELPLAPEYRPTDTEFADPIAYISKIEKEASTFGICKVIPPLPKPSKKYVFANLNKSLSKCCDELGLDVVNSDERSVRRRDGENRGALFTTRQQELGQEGKRRRVDARKQVWQSGEVYTLEQFEAKAKAFSRSVLGVAKEGVSSLGVEALFWKAACEKPVYVEYANDVPGSGFGEPEGLLGFFHPRKRRRLFPHYIRGRSYGVKNDGSVASGSSSMKEVGASGRTGPNCVPERGNDDDLSSSVRMEAALSSAEVEGTAGWKLSNSPWNLQAIARSAGSLTRFMTDNIPGVTSPMVYIGMLFSWFAWHVEDHELHSLNFLHTGSPKTWYGVPGDYANEFEEIIRRQAYGGDIDHLAALRILGEKTTLLAPKTVAASGIPCCRLVQNPGEFVVSFPRAYHLGFSHGFNCGEAANFGTPQWLIIAKEAAVRRAAMDHLPMLSHQQLLYLLTMSFISRVPESLLPGVRSSRLRDRLREGREVLVKKAFINDLLKENNLLSTLREKVSALRVVLWHPDSLPSFSREFLSQSETTPGASEFAACPDKNVKQDLNHLTLLKESVSGLYLGSDDLCYDFQVDSGTLPCVACGILGYPFMSVMQLSKKALLEVFAAQQVSRECATDILQNPSSSQLLCSTNAYVSASPDERLESLGIQRPRFFCLEHAVQIEGLLRPKGGIKIFVICHSDYPKMKAYAAAIAEEIKTSFNYKEVHLDCATEEELKLIDTAIDAEQPTDIQEDWTAKLGINLRFSVKARKDCLLKTGHALNMDYLLSVISPVSRISSITWWSRKSRTKREPGNRKQINSYDDRLHNKDKKSHELSGRVEKKGKVLLQYYRRRYRNT